MCGEGNRVEYSISVLSSVDCVREVSVDIHFGLVGSVNYCLHWLELCCGDCGHYHGICDHCQEYVVVHQVHILIAKSACAYCLCPFCDSTSESILELRFTLFPRVRWECVTYFLVFFVDFLYYIPV